MRRRVLQAVGIALALALAYLLLWPVPWEPEAWTPPEAPALEGSWAKNERLGAASLFLEGVGEGPEAFAVAPDGTLYTGLLDGRIVAVDPGASTWRDVVQTKGRPLGLDIDAEGRIVACVVHRGLMRFTVDGDEEMLADESEGVPLQYADDLDIAPDGTVWFSDASRGFGPEEVETDVIVGHSTGRLVAWREGQGARTALDGLRYANGVAVAPDGSWVAVNETFGFRITRLWLEGDRAGESELLVENLPGFPDNCEFDAKGRLWVAFVKVRSAPLDLASPRPWLRKVFLRLPGFLLPRPKPFGFVAAFDQDGELLEQLQDSSGKTFDITSVTAAGDDLVLGSLHMTSAARIAAP